MKKSLLFVGMTILLASNSITAQAQDDNLVYIAVEPCRLADTRDGRGTIPANIARQFLVSGTAGELNVQGGNTDGCVDPRATSGLDPVAISAYIVAVPTASSVGGFLTAYPSLTTPGEVATVNFAAGQVIGNTTTITLCQGSSCPADGPLAVIAPNTEQEVVIDVQGYFYPATGSCPDDMVANGDGCIDKYEASVWSTSTGDTGTQLSPAGPGGGAPNIVCDLDGSNCGAGLTDAIYALSVDGVLPAGHISWYQAAQACANVGKRLPTTAEWQTAALGTPSGDGGGCNITPGGTTPSQTGANAACVSPVGAFDMIGNVFELTAELDIPSITVDGVLVSDTTIGRSFGDDFSSTGNATTTSMFTVAPNTTNGKVGFRCAR